MAHALEKNKTNYYNNNIIVLRLNIFPSMRIRPKKTALEQNRIQIRFLPTLKKGSTEVTYMQKIAPCFLSLGGYSTKCEKFDQKVAGAE